MAIAALILGLVGVVVTLIFDAGFLVATPMALVAVVLGGLSRRSATTATNNELQTGAQWTAKAGLMVGAGALILTAFWWVPFIRAEVVLWRLHRPLPRIDISSLVKQAGGGGLQGSVVEVASTVANVQHMPGHATIALRSDKATDGWTVVCAPLSGTFPNPEPTDGESLAVRGYVKRVDTEMAMVFGRQIVLDPCLILQ